MDADALWAGLDVGQQETSVCITDRDGQPVHEGAYGSSDTELDEVLSPFRDRLRVVGVESGVGVHLTRRLRARGYPVAVFEAKRAKRYLTVRRNKTDTADARGIADIARLGKGVVSEVHVKSPEIQRLRTRLVLRQKLIRHRVAIEGLIHQTLYLHGGGKVPSRRPTLYREGVERELARIRAAGDLAVDDEVLPLLDMSERLRTYLRDVDERLVYAAEQNDVCRRLMTIPGVGTITALSFYSSIEDPWRFRRNGDVASYLGLVPRLHQSGAHSLTKGITKMGDRRTRTHLVTAATVNIRRTTGDSALKRWGLSLSSRMGNHKARVAVARKLSTIMLSIWKSGQTFDPGVLVAGTEL